MPRSHVVSSKSHSWLAWLSCYLAWLVFCAASLPLFWMLRTNMFDIALHLGASVYTVDAIDRFGTVLLGLLWLSGVMLLEFWLRNGVERQCLLSRVIRTAVVMGILFGVSFLLQEMY